MIEGLSSSGLGIASSVGSTSAPAITSFGPEISSPVISLDKTIGGFNFNDFAPISAIDIPAPTLDRFIPMGVVERFTEIIPGTQHNNHAEFRPEDDQFSTEVSASLNEIPNQVRDDRYGQVMEEIVPGTVELPAPKIEILEKMPVENLKEFTVMAQSEPVVEALTPREAEITKVLEEDGGNIITEAILVPTLPRVKEQVKEVVVIEGLKVQTEETEQQMEISEQVTDQPEITVGEAAQTEQTLDALREVFTEEKAQSLLQNALEQKGLVQEELGRIETEAQLLPMEKLGKVEDRAQSAKKKLPVFQRAEKVFKARGKAVLEAAKEAFSNTDKQESVVEGWEIAARISPEDPSLISPIVEKRDGSLSGFLAEFALVRKIRSVTEAASRGHNINDKNEPVELSEHLSAKPVSEEAVKKVIGWKTREAIRRLAILPSQIARLTEEAFSSKITPLGQI